MKQWNVYVTRRYTVTTETRRKLRDLRRLGLNSATSLFRGGKTLVVCTNKNSNLSDNEITGAM